MTPSYLSLFLILSLFCSLHPIASVPMDDYNFLDNDDVLPSQTVMSPPPPPPSITKPPSPSPSRSPNASPIPSPSLQVVSSPSSSPSRLPHASPSPSPSPVNSHAPSASRSPSPSPFPSPSYSRSRSPSPSPSSANAPQSSHYSSPSPVPSSRAPRPSPRSSPFPSPSSEPEPADSLTSLFSSSSLTSKLLKPICDKARNPDLCMSTMQSVAPSDITTLDPVEAFKLFTKAMENDTQAAINKAMQYVDDATTDDETKKGYKSCADDFRNIVSSLQGVTDAIASNEMYTAKSNLDGALHTDDCNEVMSKYPDVDVRADRDKIIELVRNALDIWVQFITPTYSKVEYVEN